MKIIQTAIAAIALTHVCSCQEIREKSYRLNVEVKDPEGNPISGVKVVTGRLVPAQGGAGLLANSVTIESSTTGSHGKIELAYKSLPEPAGKASVYTDGYYTSSYTFGWKSPGGSDGPERVGNIEAVLKPMKNPIPMHAARMTGERVVIVPEMHKEYGYDLQRAAMVAPVGTGQKSDMTIRIDGKSENKIGEPSKITATIRFADPNDGLVYFETPDRDSGSYFVGDYQAPANGYVNPLEIPFDPSEIAKNMSRTNQGNYYFRTRTMRDNTGKVISTNYGKIHGDFMLWSLSPKHGGVVQLSWIASYFNPTPNDRNVEFDPKRNLNRDSRVDRP